MEFLNERILSQVIRVRPSQSHKGTYGRVCLIGGDEQYGGAIILASEATVHSGAGLVTTITHPINHQPLHSRLPEAMVVDWFDLALVAEIISQSDVIVIGPGLGLGTHSETLLSLTLNTLKEEQICLVDGSAITLFDTLQIKLVSPDKINYIFTPHEKEWERLSHLKIPQQTEEQNRDYQQLLKSRVVLKKSRTELYLPAGIFRNPLGTPAMATGGMGDTLAGMIAGFSAQFCPLDDAISAAVYLHSFIGESLGETHYVTLPSAIIRQISQTMKCFEII